MARAGRRTWPSGLAAIGRRRELATLLVMLVLSAIVWGFAELADEVLEGGTHAFDEAVLLALRTPGDPSDPLGPDWMEETVRDLTALGGIAVVSLVSLVVVGYLLIAGKRRAALLVVVAVGGALLVNTLLKEGFDRPRPDLVPHGSNVYTTSFPSGHSMLAAAAYLTLGALLARVHAGLVTKAYFLLVAGSITFVVGASRVYLGVHWPTDVLAGWAGGAAWALACWTAALMLQRRGQVEEEPEGGATGREPERAPAGPPQPPR